jgi:uncharacterized phage protein (TIGR02218 family)
MKSVVANRRRLLPCIRIVCGSGTVFRLTDYPFDVVIGGQTYLKGYKLTGFESGTTFSPSAIDLKNYIGIGGVTEAMLMSGLFDNARAFYFFTDWSNPVVDEEEIAQCIFGKVKIEDSSYTVEQMLLVDKLNQVVGDAYTTQCQKKFGGQEPKGCLVDAVALRVTGTVGTVTNGVTFYDAALTGASGYFAWGKVWMTSGANFTNGVPAQTVKTSLDEEFEIYEPFPYTVNPGDTYTIEPGCGKYLGKCLEYDNVINFGGHLYIPGEGFIKTTGEK